MWIVRLALRRPYTFVVMAVAILLLGVVCHRHHAGRYLSLHRYPRRQRGLELRRPVAGGDGEAHRHHLRARHDHHRQRHRAHRIAVLQRRLGDPRLLPAQRQSRHGAGPGHGHLRRRCCAIMPPGIVPAQHPEVRRFQRAHPAAWAWRARRSASRRSSISARTSSAPSWPPCRARRCRCPMAASTAQVMVDLNPDAAVRQAAFADRCLERAEPAEPDPARRQRQDRRHAIIRCKLNSSPRDARRAEQSADQDGQRRHGLHEGRGAGARRLSRCRPTSCAPTARAARC